MSARHWLIGGAAVLAAGAFGGIAVGQQAAPLPAKPIYAADGTVHVPAFDLPPSGLMSPQAVAVLKIRAGMPAINAFPTGMDITKMRAGMEGLLKPLVAMSEAKYPVNEVDQQIAGVPTRVFTPKTGKVDPHRILINVHGGGFMMCANACAYLESVPIASLGNITVVSVDYREGPEAVFPAASEDVTKVYTELLKKYKASNIGMYGCSAGGALSAEMAAWLPAHNLPQVGAIGIFGAGATRFTAPGDSAYMSAYMDGSFPPPPPPGSPPMLPFRSYFDGVSQDDAMVSPASHPEVLAHFPPTLIITGTRAPDLSPAVYTHSQLVKAGVPGDLIVGEGMGHCYMYQAMLPEAQDAYSVIVNFFQHNLGRHAK